MCSAIGYRASENGQRQKRRCTEKGSGGGAVRASSGSFDCAIAKDAIAPLRMTILWRGKEDGRLLAANDTPPFRWDRKDGAPGKGRDCSAQDDDFVDGKGLTVVCWPQTIPHPLSDNDKGWGIRFVPELVSRRCEWVWFGGWRGFWREPSCARRRVGFWPWRRPSRDRRTSPSAYRPAWDRLPLWRWRP
jgi:hypothetical protein